MEETFVKRQRQPHMPKSEEHRFGQEPIMVLRERMAAHKASLEHDKDDRGDKA
jgi:hypothetical protein